VQIASAALETIVPVTSPQLSTTQSKARDAIREDAEVEHSQAKSVEAQPTTEAAEVRQATFVDIRINYILTKGYFGRETYTTAGNCRSGCAAGGAWSSKGSSGGEGRATNGKCELNELHDEFARIFE
jgi:hypothetical protein